MTTLGNKDISDRLRDLLGSPRDPEGRAFPAVAEAYRRAGQLEDAREVVEEGTANHPEMMSGQVVAARVFLGMGDHERALVAARAALSIDPENGEAADLLVLAKAAPGDATVDTATREDAYAEGPTGGAVADAHAQGPADGDVAREGAQAEEPVAEGSARKESIANEPVRAENALAEVIGTRTLAELYVKQGHLALAVAVYGDIVRRAPSDDSARARLAELEAAMNPSVRTASPARGGTAAGPGRARTRESSPPVRDSSPDDGSTVVSSGTKALHGERPDRSSNDDLESAARDLAGEGVPFEGGDDGAVFAWGGDGTDAEQRERRRVSEPTSTPSVLVIHGPNLAALGRREPLTYGNVTLPEINRRLVALGRELGIRVEAFQSNHEGEIIDRIEDGRERVAGVLINPGGLTHTSVALRDALAGSSLPFVEVHISNTAARASFRKRSLISAKAAGIVHGFGAQGYLLALRGLADKLRDPPS